MILSINDIYIAFDLAMLGIGLICTALVMIGIALIYNSNNIDADHSNSKILKYLPKVNLVVMLLLTLMFGIDIIIIG